jgi:glucose-1-phosphate thymidylyltransferase
MNDGHTSGLYDGVILAAGRGTRMMPFSEHYPKPLLPILNRPLIFHQVEFLRGLGVRKVFVVIGHLGHEIAQRLGDGSDFGVEIRYVEQRNSLGIAHAVMQLEPYIHNSFAMLLGDIFFELDKDVHPFKLMESESASGFLAVMEEPRKHALRRNFAVHMDDNRVVNRVVEKPRFPRTSVKGCGLYAFDASFFDAVRRTPQTAGRNEYEITDAIQIFIDDGAKVIGYPVVTDDTNLTFPYDVLLANLGALRGLGEQNAISKNATVSPTATLSECIVGDDVHIGDGCSLKQVVVMPGSSVSTKEPIDRAVITPDRMVDCRYWVDSQGRFIDRQDNEA